MTAVNQRHSDQTSSADETLPADPLRLTITEPARSANTLSGVIECGVLAVGDEILISPSNRAAAVVALADAVSGATVDRAGAGMRVSRTPPTVHSTLPFATGPSARRSNGF